MSKCRNSQPKKTKSKEVDILVEKFPAYLTPEQTFLARTIQREAAKVLNTVYTVHRTVYIKRTTSRRMPTMRWITSER